MDRLIGSMICGGNTQYKRNESDFYPTPPDVTFALMQKLGLPKWVPIWDPACGEMHMVNELKRVSFDGCNVVRLGRQWHKIWRNNLYAAKKARYEVILCVFW